MCQLTIWSKHPGLFNCITSAVVQLKLKVRCQLRLKWKKKTTPHEATALTAGGGGRLQIELTLLVNHTFKRWKKTENNDHRTEYAKTIIRAE